MTFWRLLQAGTVRLQAAYFREDKAYRTLRGNKSPGLQISPWNDVAGRDITAGARHSENFGNPLCRSKQIRCQRSPKAPKREHALVSTA